MAVPKKRTSKSRKNSRKSIWKGKAKIASQRSLSLAKSLLKSTQKSFIYNETLDELNKIKKSF
jgi:large subunit ribosomal protein L32